MDVYGADDEPIDHFDNVQFHSCVRVDHVAIPNLVNV